MKFGHLIEYNKRNIFLNNHAENEAGRVAPDLFFFFKKALHEVKESGLQLNPQLDIQQNKLYKTLDY